MSMLKWNLRTISVIKIRQCSRTYDLHIDDSQLFARDVTIWVFYVTRFLGLLGTMCIS